jgi:hypothetical protein
MAAHTVVWPLLSRKAPTANFVSPANDLDPDQWRLRRRLGLCERLVARMTLMLANARISGRRRAALRERIAELEAEIIGLRGRIARGARGQ